MYTLHIYYMHTHCILVYMNVYSSLSHLQTHRAQCLTFLFIYNAYSAAPPVIAEKTDDSVDTHPMLTAGQNLTLTCTTMGARQIDWYKGDKNITNSSQIEINKTEICDPRLVSTLIIPSVTVADSGTYECQVENSAGCTFLQYKVVVSECVHSDIHHWRCHCHYQSPTP